MSKTFKLGRIVVAKEVDELMKHSPMFSRFVTTSLGRYANCDWGDSSDEDKAANDAAIDSGERIFASYGHEKSKKHKKIWIITEADRKVTTILFPDQY